MEIVNRQQFLALPPGTIYSKYEPCVFEGWKIKGDSLPNDFFYQCLDPGFDVGAPLHETLFAIEAGLPSPPMDFNCENRDGLFHEEQLFAVLSVADAEALIARMQEAVAALTATTTEYKTA